MTKRPRDRDGERRWHFGIKLFSAPVLVTAVEPVGEVHFGNGIRERGVALLIELADDVAVTETVVEHLVDAQTEGHKDPNAGFTA